MLQRDITLNVVAPVALADYTRPGLIVPELRQADTAGIISELSQVLQRGGEIRDVLPFYQAALNQELLSNSALSCGIALPHARLNGIKQVVFALGRLPRPVLWGSGNPVAVRLVFLLAVPATDAAGYLHLLSSLARLGQQPSLLAELQLAREAEGMLKVLKKNSLR
jgi:mannitol/fructose-specific phosphotransferase system IIA component (Ntr-type)